MIPRIVRDKPRPRPIGPFMFHLYKSQECPNRREEEMYETAEVMVEFGVKKPVRPVASSSDSDSDVPESTPAAPATPLLKKRKVTFRTVHRTPTGSGHLEMEREEHLKAFKVIINHTHWVQEGYDWLNKIVTGACKLAGGVKPQQLIET